MSTPTENTSQLRPTTAEQPSVTTSLSHAIEDVLPGQRVSVFTFNGKKYFVGVQLASVLKRETFNLYRSMKIKNVGVSRANHDQVLYLVKVGAVRSGTHSVTLLDYDSCLSFLRDTSKKRRSEPDIVAPGKSMMEFDRPPLKQRRASSAMVLGGSPLQQRRVSLAEASPSADFNMQGRNPAARHIVPSSWEPELGVLPGPMIYVRDREQQQVQSDSATNRWYFRPPPPPPPMYWVAVPAAAHVPEAAHQGWNASSAATPPADQNSAEPVTRSLLERVEALATPQDPELDGLREMASEI